MFLNSCLANWWDHKLYDLFSFISSQEMAGRRKEGVREIQKFEYLEKKKSFLEDLYKNSYQDLYKNRAAFKVFHNLSSYQQKCGYNFRFTESYQSLLENFNSSNYLEHLK